jgi:hypothetical protein
MVTDHNMPKTTAPAISPDSPKLTARGAAAFLVCCAGAVPVVVAPVSVAVASSVKAPEASVPVGEKKLVAKPAESERLLEAESVAAAKDESVEVAKDESVAAAEAASVAAPLAASLGAA